MGLKLTEKDFEEITSDPLKLFYGSIKSPETRRQYEGYLKDFVCNVLCDVLDGSFEERAKQFIDISKTNPDKLSKIMYAYISAVKKRTELPKGNPDHIGTNALKNRFKPIQKFLEMNDVLFNWKRFRSTFPEPRSENPESRGYTKEEIRTILKYSRGIIEDAIVLVASSSGIRVGAFDFKWGDITPVYRIRDNLTLDITESEVKQAQTVCAIIVVYRGTRDEYAAFITPEAYNILMEYKKVWAREKLREPKDTDHVFMRVGIKNMPLHKKAITARVSRMIRRSGIRDILSDPQKRHNVPVMHGFRKFFNKTIKNTPSDSQFIGQYILKERMMGHSSLVGLDKNYYKEHVLEKVEEYLKSVPYLTISEEEKVKAENVKLTNKIQERDSSYEDFETLREDYRKGYQQMQELTKIVETILNLPRKPGARTLGELLENITRSPKLVVRTNLGRHGD